MIKNTRFSNTESTEFIDSVRKQVAQYFESTGRSRSGSWKLIIKSIVMFSLFFAPYFVLLFGGITNPWLFVALWLVMGVGMAGIGLSVMHDANHGTLSSIKWLNTLMGYSANLLGSHVAVWKMQHNRLHHTYTNVQGADEDLNASFILRLSPDQKWRKIHRYQHVYAWAMYSLLTLARASITEFVQVFSFRKMNLLNGKKAFRNMLAKLTISKVIHHGYLLVIPLIFIDQPAWLIIVSFLTMHLLAGLILSMIFQAAHVMPNCEFPKADEKGALPHSWAIHELLTTSNFAPRSRLLTWFVGGLNFQVEHHLFPQISHIHYRHISRIVADTAREFGLPYNTYPTFLSAMKHHAQMLRELGQKPTLTAA